MKRIPLIPTFVLALLAAGVVVVLAAQPGSNPPDFLTGITGADEVPLRVTDATGNAKFQINATGTAINYTLKVDNINNVVASHIHLAPKGVNGPIVAFLFGTAPSGGGPVSGTLATGTITAANLVGPLAGQQLSVLIQAMQTGGTYVNVHTNDGVAPTDTGPGDFPGGEMRGQIKGNGNARRLAPVPGEPLEPQAPMEPINTDEIPCH